MVSRLLISLVISLILTILFEELFAVIAGIRDRRDLLLLCLMNVITNPVVVFLYHLTAEFTELNLNIVVLFLETAAILTEGVYYKSYGRTFRHPFLFTVCANIFSYGIGEIISNIF
jgi:hypothetical protein